MPITPRRPGVLASRSRHDTKEESARIGSIRKSLGPRTAPTEVAAARCRKALAAQERRRDSIQQPPGRQLGGAEERVGVLGELENGDRGRNPRIENLPTSAYRAERSCHSDATEKCCQVSSRGLEPTPRGSEGKG